MGLSLLVVATHVLPPSTTPNLSGTASYLVVNGLARVAVPLFFMFTGFRITADFASSVYKRRMLRALKLFLVWQLIYLYFPLKQALATHSLFDLFCAMVHGYWHLWYLAALLSSMTLLYLLRRRCSQTTIFALGVFLYLLGWELQLMVKYGLFAGDPRFQYAYSLMGSARNGLFFGLFFIAIGWTMPRWQTYFKSRRTAVWVGAGALGGLLAESLIYRHVLNGSMDLYLCAVPLAMSVLYVVQSGWSPGRLPRISPHLAIGVFLLHPLIIRVFEALHLGFAPLLTYLLVIGASLALDLVACRVNKRVRVLF